MGAARLPFPRSARTACRALCVPSSSPPGRGEAGSQPVENRATSRKQGLVRTMATSGGGGGDGPMQWLPRRLLQVQDARSGPRVRVLTWNILADGMAQNGGFVTTDPRDLEWDRRLPRIVREIAESGCDVCVLQECNNWEGGVRPAVNALGLDGVFFAKQDSPAVGYGAEPDGLALLYRRGAVEMEWHECHTYTDPAQGGRQCNQMCLLAGMRHVETGVRFVAATTHLKAKESPANDALRESQARQLVERVAAARRRVAGAAGARGRRGGRRGRGGRAAAAGPGGGLQLRAGQPRGAGGVAGLPGGGWAVGRARVGRGGAAGGGVGGGRVAGVRVHDVEVPRQ
ncbi:unnamed protein product [Pedinophyceae sp. YPF-701]|nr:unnamed protein product [Pedinophyceae sp. YPF-701]